MVDFGQSDVVRFSRWVLWVLSALLAANEGLVFTATTMIGVGAVENDAKSMILYGLAGLIAGTVTTATSVFNSQIKEGRGVKEAVLVALVAVLAFLVGGMVPLLSAAFIKLHMVRLVVAAVVTMALMVFGGLWAKLVRAPMGKSCVLLIGAAWLAMLVNFGFMKLLESHVGIK